VSSLVGDSFRDPGAGEPNVAVGFHLLAADAFELLLLQRAQELDLHRGRDVADLVLPAALAARAAGVVTSTALYAWLILILAGDVLAALDPARDGHMGDSVGCCSAGSPRSPTPHLSMSGFASSM
jgi:hypothetical protein